MKRVMVVAGGLLLAAVAWWLLQPSSESVASDEVMKERPIVQRANEMPTVPVAAIATPSAPDSNVAEAVPLDAPSVPSLLPEREKRSARQERLREYLCEGEQWHATLLQSLTAAEKKLSAKHRIKQLTQLGPILTAMRDTNSAHDACVQNVETIESVLQAAE